MRLMNLEKTIENKIRTRGVEYEESEEYVMDMHDLELQRNYGSMILKIGEGQTDHYYCDLVDENQDAGKQLLRLSHMKHFIHNREGIAEAIAWLYPNGFDPAAAVGATILAATNAQVDEYNTTIQAMNPSAPVILKSKDRLGEVDDPNGYLCAMLTPSVLNELNHISAPPHILTLKVNDICLVTRKLSKRFDLATNTRVRILEIRPNHIRVQTLKQPAQTVCLPRITFKFRLPFGKSFEMIRIQFPLRLAYAMTYNKSQGQTLLRVLLDVVIPPFAHGHLYVALSRVTFYAHIAVICLEEQVYEDAPLANTTTYTTLLI